MALIACRRRLPFFRIPCHMLVIFIFCVASMFYYLTNSHSPWEFNDFANKTPASSRVFAESKKAIFQSDKVEILEENEVDPLVGIVEETTPESYQCRIPPIDPWDDSLESLIKHPRSVECKRVQPDLVHVDDAGVLRLNLSAVREFEKRENISVKCEYKYFDRGETDRDLVYEKPRPLSDFVSLERSFVKVSCRRGNSNNKIYNNVFSYPMPLTSDQHLLAGRPRKYLSRDGDDFNVLIFTLESTSSSMAVRHLPKTLQYLKDTGAVVFKKFLKTGENTLPNLAPLFTGLRDRTEQESMSAELPPPTDGFYDSWPMIWDRFRLEKGYETVFVEDQSHLSTFHYGGVKGFKRKPVDYWYFPFWESQRRLGKPINNSSAFCSGNTPKYEIWTQILRRHIRKSKTRRQFLFSLLGVLSHDHTSDLERADDHFFDFFHRLDVGNFLNRTIIFVVGDHGPRFSSIRPTVVGFAEERLPFFSIRIPSSLQAKYPSLMENLKTNRKRLTSWFDIHETLLDILNQTFDDRMSDDRRSARGRSIFRPLPLDRTCAQAGVPDRYCLCNGYTITDIGHRLALPAAKKVNAEVNKLIKGHKNKCASWKVEKVIYFLHVPWPEEVTTETRTYFIAFVAQPLKAIFEGVVVRNLTDDSLIYKEGTLERINSFGHYGSCLPKVSLWKFCVCRKYVRAVQKKVQ